MTGWYLTAVLVAVIVALLVALRIVYKRYKRTDGKIKFMLSAIDNGDYTFMFRTDTTSENEKWINESLNAISTMLKNARIEQMESEKFYEIIINSVRTGVLVVDANGHILRSNDSAMRLIGLHVLNHTEQIGRVSDELRRKIERLKVGEKLQASVQDERGTTSLQLQAADAVLKGKQVRIISLNDINAALDENELDSWTKLIRVLTHEIMNTVAPITSLSETLMAKADSEELHDGLEVIQKTSRELMAFVENYRKLTHLPTPVPTLFYVKPFAERLRQMALPLAEGCGITIHVDVQPADLILYADENLVAHVVNNLLKNAVQAIGQQQGNVWLKAWTNDDESITIDVVDDGPLIAADVAKHIFVPFFTTKKSGSGIGLSVSRQIMRLSGGSLVLKTDRKRGLTIFEMVFP